MKAEDLILVSVDDHLVEPPDMFEGHIPDEVQGPGAEGRPQRARATTCGPSTASVIPNVGLNAVAGRPKEEYGIEPTAFDEMRPGCYDIDERIKDMNAGGVLGSMCFPSFPGFSGRLFAAAEDKDLALAVLRAYNDWHVDEWCGTLPGPLHPDGPARSCGTPSSRAEEVRRLAKKGVHSVTFTENPATLGYPSFHNEHWDPLWQALHRRGRGALDPPRLVRPAGGHRHPTRRST